MPHAGWVELLTESVVDTSLVSVPAVQCRRAGSDLTGGDRLNIALQSGHQGALGAASDTPWLALDPP
jgi:hypothetical protein